MDILIYTAFLGWDRLVTGPLDVVLTTVKQRIDLGPLGEALLIFEDLTGRQVDFDLRGSMPDILARIAPPPVRSGPGRPRLGVTSREVSLLPRHWEWLETQPSGASAALRRLIDDTRKQSPEGSQGRATIDAVGRVMTAIGGNLPGFEEAYRSLYASDRMRLEQCVADWPADLREYVLAHAPQA